MRTADAKVLIVIPAHNEQESLARTVAEVRAKSPAVALVVVDDGSTDRTVDVARACRVPILRLPFNLGVGAALQTGFRYALDNGFDVAVQLDADGQHDPAYLAALLRPVIAGEADVSIGSRYVTGRTSYQAPALRRLGMVFFSWIVRWAVGFTIADTTSGFRAYNCAVMAVGARDFPKDFPDAPLLIALARRGFRLVEVPVEMRAREAGQSFYTWTKSLYYPYKCLLASAMVLLRRRGNEEAT